jgi:hypothetical protein
MILPILGAMAASCAINAAFAVGFDLFANWLTGRKTTLGGLLVSAAVGCVAGLAFVGLGALLADPFEALAQVTLNRLSGLGAEQALRDSLGAVAERFWTPLGDRIVDAFAGGVANEAKVGLTKYSQRVYEEILKDAWLLKTGKVSSVVWNFYPSSTGIGPTKDIENVLIKYGIQIVIHP